MVKASSWRDTVSKKKRRGSGVLAALLSVLLLGLCAFVLVGFQVVELPAFLVLEEPSALAPQATPTPRILKGSGTC